MRHSGILAATLIVLLAASGLPARSAGAERANATWKDKVDPWVLDTADQGPTEFLVFLTQQADISAASGLVTKAERGEYVYRTLSQHAERAQGPLRRRLAELGAAYRPYWVANMIWVRGGPDLIQALAERPDVAHIYANPKVRLDVVATTAPVDALPTEANEVNTVEWNLTKVKAPDVWALGTKGAGVVIGGQDTGYRWTHNALQGKYRGGAGASAIHDYNWHDAIHEGGSDCGADSPTPCDDHGQGTHTMGTMVGDDGASNQIGLAPAAKWIGCRNMNAGFGTPASYSECYQWFIAPTKVDGTGADPGMAPDVINNSWGCPPEEGCTNPNVLLTVVQNVTASGIVTVHSAGNEGPGCGTVATPAGVYAESFSVGATDSNDLVASSSSRGPVTVDGSNRMKPNISAPGVGIRSSTAGTDTSYGSMSGTSMAGPHVAGLVALMISANPGLRGSVDALRTMIEQSAVPRPVVQVCGSSGTPNNVYGWGRIDALAAVQQATACQPPAAISDLSIAKQSPGEVKLEWGAVAGATAYHVSWDGKPYFDPVARCAGYKCSVVTGTSHTQAALGDTALNQVWVVGAKSACGAVRLPGSNRVGEFEFPLVNGAP